jgi:hypothetical protein
MSNSHVPRIELNQDGTINLVVDVYGFDVETPIEISGQVTQENGAVAPFYSVQFMPISTGESALLSVASIPVVPGINFTPGFPIKVFVRAAESWITTLDEDMGPAALQGHMTFGQLAAAWKEVNTRSALSPDGQSRPSGIESEATERATEHVRLSRMEPEFGILRLEINGNWSVDAFTHLLTQLEQAYFAAAALEALTEPGTINISSFTGPPEQAAKDLTSTVAALRLGGGLQVGSLQYGSPGYIEVIGALNPLNTVEKGITNNREINRKREEMKLSDERERQRQSDEHEQAMDEGSRLREQMRLEHEREMAKLKIEVLRILIDSLPIEERNATAAELIRTLDGNTESIANDSRVRKARMLGTGERAATETVKADPGTEASTT